MSVFMVIALAILAFFVFWPVIDLSGDDDEAENFEKEEPDESDDEDDDWDFPDGMA